MTELVWYACYGSNLARDRFERYLTGDESHAGARDQAPPRAAVAASVQHALGFGLMSRRWGGGVAFLHRQPGSGTALVGLWLVTIEQYADVLAQENGLAPGELHVVVHDGAAGSAPSVTCSGPDLRHAPYGSLLHLGTRAGLAVLSFTAAEAPAPNRPSPAYLAVMARGLADVHHLDRGAVTTYLAGRAIGWSRADLARAVEPASAGPDATP